MRVRVWGCRGSLAAPGPETVRYGGNTSCVEVELDDGTLLVLDAGSGLRPLGRRLAATPDRPVHLLLTHLHLDHLQGLAFFSPLWDPAARIEVWGPASPTQPLEERVAAYISPPLFPIHLSDVPSAIRFHDVPEGDFTVGSARISAVNVSHQGPTLGYRITADGRTLAYIPDHEPSLAGLDLGSLDPAWISGHAVAEGADVLFHDAQYFEEEYPAHVGWGHSSIDHVVTFARIAAVGQLVLFHHDPEHSDAQLEVLLGRACELWGGQGKPPVLAYEGMTIELHSSAVSVPAGEAATG